jgi:hypothetical protein
MGSTTQIGGTLDVVAITPELSLRVGGVVRDGQDIEMRGHFSDPDRQLDALPIVFSMNWENLISGASFERVDNQLVRFYEDGRAGSIGDYSELPALGGRYTVHAGTAVSQEGRQVDVFAIADPVPIVVVGAALLGAVCLVGGGISWLIDWAQSKTTGQAADCRARGGYPKVSLQFSVSFSWRRREFGCTAKPRFRCENAQGDLIFEQEGTEESVHALAAGRS